MHSSENRTLSKKDGSSRRYSRLAKHQRSLFSFVRLGQIVRYSMHVAALAFLEIGSTPYSQVFEDPPLLDVP